MQVDFFEKEIGRMSQQEEHRRGTEIEGQRESEHKPDNTQYENREHAAISGDGQGGAAVVVENQGTQSGKGHGTDTKVSEGVEDVENAMGAQALDTNGAIAVTDKVAGSVDAESDMSESQPAASIISKVPSHTGKLFSFQQGHSDSLTSIH